MSKRKPILLISTKFPNHIVFFSNHKLANSNYTKPINNKKEKDIFNPKKGTFGEGEPGDNIIAEFVYSHGVILLAPFGVPTSKRGLGISLLSISTDPPPTKLFEDHHLNPLERLSLPKSKNLSAFSLVRVVRHGKQSVESAKSPKRRVRARQ